MDSHKPKKTSINVFKKTVGTSSVEVVPNNPKRVGLTFSQANHDYSLSFQPGVVINQGTFNVKTASQWIQTLCCCDYGTSLQMPMYGIAGTSGTVVEFTEVLLEE